MNVVVIASGKSLTFEDVKHCCGRASVLAVNDCWQWAPWCDWLYAADYDWWRSSPRFMTDDAGAIRAAHEYTKSNADLTERMGLRRYTMDPDAARHFGLSHVNSADAPGLGNADMIHLGGNSGYQAINLAVMLGAKRIFLLGFDMGATGLGHWFGAHPVIEKKSPAGIPFSEDLERTRMDCFAEWRTKFPRLAGDLSKAGIEVVNCTRQTTLMCFPMAPITEALP